MEKKHLESLDHEMFENLPEEVLGHASGGIIVTTSNRGGATHVGRIADEEFADG